jgi:hypothetical protein
MPPVVVVDLYGNRFEMIVPESGTVGLIKAYLMSVDIFTADCELCHNGYWLPDNYAVTDDCLSRDNIFVLFNKSFYGEKSFPVVDGAFRFHESRYQRFFCDEDLQKDAELEFSGRRAANVHRARFHRFSESFPENPINTLLDLFRSGVEFRRNGPRGQLQLDIRLARALDGPAAETLESLAALARSYQMTQDLRRSIDEEDGDSDEEDATDSADAEQSSELGDEPEDGISELLGGAYWISGGDSDEDNSGSLVD